MPGTVRHSSIPWSAPAEHEELGRQQIPLGSPGLSSAPRGCASPAAEGLNLQGNHIRDTLAQESERFHCPGTALTLPGFVGKVLPPFFGILFSDPSTDPAYFPWIPFSSQACSSCEQLQCWLSSLPKPHFPPHCCVYHTFLCQEGTKPQGLGQAGELDTPLSLKSPLS